MARTNPRRKHNRYLAEDMGVLPVERIMINPKEIETALDEWAEHRIITCEEVVHHGPGHQSTTHCQVDATYPHEIHYASNIGEFWESAVWRTGDNTAKDADRDDELMALFEKESAERAKVSRIARANFVAEYLNRR